MGVRACACEEVCGLVSVSWAVPQVSEQLLLWKLRESFETFLKASRPPPPQHTHTQSVIGRGRGGGAPRRFWRSLSRISTLLDPSRSAWPVRDGCVSTLVFSPYPSRAFHEPFKKNQSLPRAFSKKSLLESSVIFWRGEGGNPLSSGIFWTLLEAPRGLAT